MKTLILRQMDDESTGDVLEQKPKMAPVTPYAANCTRSAPSSPFLTILAMLDSWHLPRLGILIPSPTAARISISVAICVPTIPNLTPSSLGDPFSRLNSPESGTEDLIDIHDGFLWHTISGCVPDAATPPPPLDPWGVGLSGSVTRHPPCLTSALQWWLACCSQTRCHPTSDCTPFVSNCHNFPQGRRQATLQFSIMPYSQIREQNCRASSEGWTRKHLMTGLSILPTGTPYQSFLGLKTPLIPSVHVGFRQSCQGGLHRDRPITLLPPPVCRVRTFHIFVRAGWCFEELNVCGMLSVAQMVDFL